MKNSKQREFLDSLKSMMPEYLQLEGIGIQNKKAFSCIIPGCKHEHGDANASSGFVQNTNNTLIHCFKSGITVDIYALHAARHNLPTAGSRWWQETVPNLCETLGVKLPTDFFDEADRELYNSLRAYKDAAYYIATNYAKNKKAREYLFNKRLWTPEVLSDCMVGAIPSYAAYQRYMAQRGWDPDFLNRVNLLYKRIFDPDRIIFCVCDAWGAPVGFAARSITYTEKKEELNPQEFREFVQESGIRKYYNSMASSIYRKGELLYNLHRAVKYDRVIYVVEGYPDVVTMSEHGIKNVVALGSTSAREEHLTNAAQLGVRKVIAIGDADDGGERMLNTVIDNMVSNSVGIEVVIKQLPEGTDDPDTFLHTTGSADALREIPEVDPIVWMSSKITDENRQVMMEKIITSIVTIPQNYRREGVIRKLSKSLDISAEALWSDVRNEEMRSSELVRNRTNKTVDDLTRKLRQTKGDPDSLKTVLSTTLETLDDILITDVDYEQVFSNDYTLLRDTMAKEGAARFNLGPDFALLDAAIDGIPVKGTLTFIGADPNHGKTSFMRHLAVSTAVNDSDAYVIYCTLDDSFASFMPVAVSVLTGVHKKAVEKVGDESPKARERANTAWDTWQQNIDRMLVVDNAAASKLSSIFDIVRYVQTKHPEKNILLFIDAMNDIMEAHTNTSDTARHSIGLVSRTLKTMATNEGISIVASAHLRKLGGTRRPHKEDIAESKKLEYSANRIFMMYNEHRATGGKSEMVFYPDDQNINYPWPVIELNIAKHKTDGFAGNLYYILDPRYMRLREVREVELISRYAELSKSGKHSTNSLTRICKKLFPETIDMAG